MTRFALAAPLLTLALGAASSANAADWVHWRGPAQDGYSREKGLPAEFDPAQKEKGNVRWTAPFGGRTAPLVMAGRIYAFQGFGEGITEGERVVCLDEKTGKKVWEHVERVYHADVVSSRLAWTPMTADPATGRVYVLSTAGNLVCLDKDGKPVWQRQMAEEFGRFTGYGGRVGAPVFDSGLVMLGFISSSWGDQARGGNRFYAFDGTTGAVVWIADTAVPPKSTYQSNPIVAVIGGQRLLISGTGDGFLSAFKVRTGELAWSYLFCGGHASPSPVFDGNLVYAAHGEENPGGGVIGKIICVDASQIDPKTKKPKLVWEYTRGQRFGLSSPALADGVLYMPEDSGELFAFDAKTGKLLWKYRYATEVRGAPLVADGKIYIFDVKGNFSIIPLVDKGKKPPVADDVFVYTFREPGRQTETNGTPIAVNGHVYFTTRTDLYCLGEPDAKAAPAAYPPVPAEPASDGKVFGVRVFPAETTAKPGETVKLQVVYFDANGREVKAAPEGSPAWTIATPAKTPNGAQPPPLAGKVEGTATEATVVLGPLPVQQGYVDLKVGALAARARIRVAAQLPAKTDFDKAPDGSSPAGWVNTNGKFIVRKLPDGNQALSKVNNDARPPLAKAIGYITAPGAANYTIQADVMGTLVRGKLPDAGLVNSRYMLVLDGKPDAGSGKRTLRIVAWEARERINAKLDFDWQPDVWYSLKFVVEPGPKATKLRGKIWKKGEPEPEAWTLEFDDPFPTPNGAAGLYGYIPNVSEGGGKVEAGSELYFDNLSVTPNAVRGGK